jgi:dTDP-4-amino-4,6-dideoxygalactose transaminase
MIPYSNLYLQNKKIHLKSLFEINRMVKRNEFILGNELLKFESEFSKFINCKYTVGVSNGTDAIEVALRALNLPPESEVIVPSNSFVASALGVLKAGLKLVLVDVNPKHYLIDVEQVQRKLTQKTRVILPVHLYGQCAPMKEISEFAKEKDLYIVEDLAQAQGATHLGLNAGSWGQINATSFYPGKNLGAWGDAGAVLTNDPELHSRAKNLRNYGSKEKYIHDSIGFNYRLDSIQAIVLKNKLKYLKQWNDRRIEIASIYLNTLSNCEQIELPNVIEGNKHVYHIFPILVEKRDNLQKYLASKGIETFIHYPVPIHLQKIFVNKFESKDFKVSEELAGKQLSLPLYPGMKNKDVIKIAETIIEFHKKL